MVMKTIVVSEQRINIKSEEHDAKETFTYRTAIVFINKRLAVCLRSSTSSVNVACSMPLEAFYPHSKTIRYDTRCYFNVRSKADMSQLNLPHVEDNYVVVVAKFW